MGSVFVVSSHTHPPPPRFLRRRPSRWPLPAAAAARAVWPALARGRSAHCANGASEPRAAAASSSSGRAATAVGPCHGPPRPALGAAGRSGAPSWAARRLYSLAQCAELRHARPGRGVGLLCPLGGGGVRPNQFTAAELSQAAAELSQAAAASVVESRGRLGCSFIRSQAAFLFLPPSRNCPAAARRH